MIACTLSPRAKVESIDDLAWQVQVSGDVILDHPNHLVESVTLQLAR